MIAFGKERKQTSKESLRKRIAAANGSVQADVVIQNGKIIDVFNGEIIDGDVAICEGYFVGIGKYEGDNVIDAHGKYVCPAFIDGHVHIESSMVTPAEFSRVVIPHGVTTVIADPHEIANVAGVNGIRYMLDSSEGQPLDIYIMLPSSVPATSFETSGAKLEAEDLEPFLKHPRVLGLGEVMNYPAVLNAEEGMLDKLIMLEKASGKIDGHAAGLDGKGINVYMTANIRTDHECVTKPEASDRLARGMYLMIREGTAAKNLEELIGLVTSGNSRRCLFVTDDKHLDDLVEEGSVDHNIRLAIKRGVPPITAIQMASLNTAECFGLDRKGAIAPGYEADFLLLESIEEIKIAQVYKKGTLVAEEGLATYCIDMRSNPRKSDKLRNTINLENIDEEELRISIKGQRAHVIDIIPNSLMTTNTVATVKVENGTFFPSTERDELKIAVIQRHNSNKSIGKGIVRGFGLKFGAMASTVVHDSHNIILVGTNDSDLLLAVEKIKQMQGGLVVVQNGKILSSLALPVGGIMSDLPYEDVLDGLKSLNLAVTSIGVNTSFNPFLTMSFLALPVIPELKITDKGLFDVIKFKHIEVEERDMS